MEERLLIWLERICEKKEVLGFEVHVEEEGEEAAELVATGAFAGEVVATVKLARRSGTEELCRRWQWALSLKQSSLHW